MYGPRIKIIENNNSVRSMSSIHRSRGRCLDMDYRRRRRRRGRRRTLLRRLL